MTNERPRRSVDGPHPGPGAPTGSPGQRLPERCRGGIAAILVALVAGTCALCCSSGDAPAASPSPVAGSEPEGTPRPEEGSEQDDDGETVRVEGVLTGEGIECQALRTAEDELFTLTGDLEGFATGDRVRVEGRVARFSICMQGTTVAVERIERLD